MLFTLLQRAPALSVLMVPVFFRPWDQGWWTGVSVGLSHSCPRFLWGSDLVICLIVVTKYPAKATIEGREGLVSLTGLGEAKCEAAGHMTSTVRKAERSMLTLKSSSPFHSVRDPNPMASLTVWVSFSFPPLYPTRNSFPDEFIPICQVEIQC